MPFSDDVNLSRLEKLSANLLLIDVFSAPQRFRFNHLGEKIIKKFGANIAGKFADESESHAPFNCFIAQASTTVEAQAPTLYSSSSGGKRIKAEGRHAASCAHLVSLSGRSILLPRQPVGEESFAALFGPFPQLAVCESVRG